MPASPEIKALLPRFFSLVRNVGLDEETRHLLIYQFTDGRTESAAELRKDEMDAILLHLSGNRPKNEPNEGNAMRRKIIHYAHLIGWKQENGKADMDRINTWCDKSGIYHKPLSLHTRPELIDVLNQFEAMYKTYLKNL